MSTQWLHGDLTGQIIAAAGRVYNVLGSGFLEKVYENAMAVELTLSDVRCVQQAEVEVSYRGRVMGTYYADLLVEDEVIVELKAIE